MSDFYRVSGTHVETYDSFEEMMEAEQKQQEKAAKWISEDQKKTPRR